MDCSYFSILLRDLQYTLKNLLFLPLIIGHTQVRALLDSGASDSFIGEELVQGLGLESYPLMQRLTVKVANGENGATANVGTD